MRKALLITTIICGMMAAGTAFSQHTQSLSFIPSATIFQQNDIFTVETFLTYSGYSMHFSITNAAPGVYTFFTTTDNPRPSIVVDQDFNDNNIPQASFSITIVPEPTTLALLALTGTGVGLLAYRRWRAAR